MSVMHEPLSDLVAESGPPLIKSNAEPIDLRSHPGFWNALYEIAKADEEVERRERIETSRALASLQGTYID